MKIGKVDFNNNRTNIMAIINLTPDSFFDGGRFFCDGKVQVDKVLATVEELINDGADILDIGGESTRPGYVPISDDEELERIIPSLRAIKSNFDIPVSVDTYKAGVAKTVIEEKADMINDIGFLSDDMLQAIANKNIAYCLMHNRDNTDIIRDESSITMDELNKEISDKLLLLKEHGLDESNVMIDPGIGFGKSNKDDIMILSNMSKLHIHNYPVLIAASNKSCIDYVMNLDKNDRLEGTLAITAKAFYNSINFVRVHNVKSNDRLLNMLEAMGR